MTTQWILLSILGFLSGSHIIIHLHTLRVISAETLARLQIFLPPTCLLAMFVMREHLLLAVVMILLVHLFSPLLMTMNQILRKSRFQREILPFLDEVLLKMRGGCGFRDAIAESVSRSRRHSSTDLAELPAFLFFPERETGFHLIAEAQELLFELRKMDQSSARIVEKMKAFRKKERMVQRFRQKSCQVTSQVRAQAAVCSILYLLLLAWTLFSRGLSVLTSPFVWGSFMLFGCGVMGFFLIARSFKWKI